MTKRSAHHATFVIERSYAAPPARVFAAWADPKAKARWFVGPDEWEKSDHKLDFPVGGKESVSGGPPGGPNHIYNAIYQDIVPHEPISTTSPRARRARATCSTTWMLFFPTLLPGADPCRK